MNRITITINGDIYVNHNEELEKKYHNYELEDEDENELIEEIEDEFEDIYEADDDFDDDNPDDYDIEDLLTEIAEEMHDEYSMRVRMDKEIVNLLEKFDSEVKELRKIICDHIVKSEKEKNK